VLSVASVEERHEWTGVNEYAAHVFAVEATR
jgi:hypothetical protein